MSDDFSGPQLPAPGPQAFLPLPGFEPPSSDANARKDDGANVGAPFNQTFDAFFEEKRPQSLPSLLERRRSVRHFREAPLSADAVDTIVQRAAWAPSGGNAQLWKVSALSPDMTEQFLKTYERRGWAALVPKLHAVAERRLGTDAPVVEREKVVRNMIESDGVTKGKPWMLVVHRPPAEKANRWRLLWRAIWRPLYGGSRLQALRDVFVVNGRIDPEVNAHSAAMYLFALALAATEHGAGSCIQYSPRAFSSALRKMAKVPSDHQVVGTILVGHTDEESPAVQHALARAKRQPVAIIWP